MLSHSRAVGHPGLGDRKNQAISLGNLAGTAQIPLGELKNAEHSLRRRIKICQEIKDDFREAVAHLTLGRLHSYQGKFEGSKADLVKSEEYFNKHNLQQWLGINHFYFAHRAPFMSDIESLLKRAKEAREFADVEHFERDIINAEWLLGAAYLATRDNKEAEKHLDEALKRDRRINLVELEPDILLELAKLQLRQKHKGYREEVLELANEALGIADRCEYRLKQADIHNFLAEFYLDKKDYKTAKKHADIARERAECGYKPALDKAKKLIILAKEKSK